MKGFMFMLQTLVYHKYYFEVRPAPVNLDVMVAESMRDVPSDEELSGEKK
jgi:hypothetical protein